MNMTWWKDLLRARAEEWTLLRVGDVGAEHGQDVVADQAYLTIVLRSLKIVNTRIGFAKFYGTVHSVISVPSADGATDFTFIFTPGDQPYIDAGNADRIVVVDKELLGGVPYRGGNVKVNLGLYAVKEADLALPYLKLLQSIAGQSGVSFVTAAIPFAAPLKDGIDLLMGTQKQATLEIGLSEDFSPPRIGTYVIMRAPKGLFSGQSVTVDRDGKLLDTKGEPIRDYPYIVFEVKQSSIRANWIQIPEVATSYGQLNEAIRSGSNSRIDESFHVFRRLVLTSPDLLDSDAERLTVVVKSRLDRVREGDVSRSMRNTLGLSELPPLDQIELF